MDDEPSREPITRDRIIDRALAIADAEGLERVSLHRIAKDFGVTPMALYWHINKKDELLDALADRFYLDLENTDRPTAHWSGILKDCMYDLLHAVEKHPHISALILPRMLHNPSGRRLTETALCALREGGFTIHQATQIGRQAQRFTINLVTEPTFFGASLDPVRRSEMEAQYEELLNGLTETEFPNVIAAADEFRSTSQRPEFYQLGIDIFIAGVVTLSEHLDPAADSRML